MRTHVLKDPIWVCALDTLVGGIVPSVVDALVGIGGGMAGLPEPVMA